MIKPDAWYTKVWLLKQLRTSDETYDRFPNDEIQPAGIHLLSPLHWKQIEKNPFNENL